MGVHGLWSLLKEAQVKKSLSDLSGETIAVDLAIWICEAECVQQMKTHVLRPYLRNLFYRLVKLIRRGVKLVFVTDGIAPQLKWKTMSQRLNARGDGFQTNIISGSRNSMNIKFKECCELLDSFGIVWLKSEGEAEATCAALNMNGMVDACITNDGDAFLYGAKKVYRNFNCNEKDTAIECYEMKVIKEKLQLNRDSLIALGLLLGCDYNPEGVPGVGKVTAIKLLSSWKGQNNPLDNMKKWRSKSAQSKQEAKPIHCSQCKHQGTKIVHQKFGCDTCQYQCKEGAIMPLQCTCSWHTEEMSRKEHALEEKIAEKARKIPDFPKQSIIDEFQRKRNIEKPNNSSSPNLQRIVECLVNKLNWNEKEACRKALPVSTYWLLNHPTDKVDLEIGSIVRTRTVDRVPVFEVDWITSLCGSVITVEPQDLLEKAFPNIVNEFWDKINKEKNEKKHKRKQKSVKAEKGSTKMTDFYAIKRSGYSKKRVCNDDSDMTNSYLKDANSLIPALNSIDLNSSPQRDKALKKFQHTLSTEGDDMSEVFSSSQSTVKPVFYDLTNTNEVGNNKLDLKASLVEDRSQLDDEQAQNVTADVTFQLDFSLGQSLLYSPAEENARLANQTPDMKSSNIRAGFKDSSSLLLALDSPGYMSLAERIKLKS